MLNQEIRYDADAKSVYLVLGTGQKFDIGAARTLSKIARSGEFEGQPVGTAEVRFSDRALAKKHADALSFLNVRTVSPDGVLKGAPIRARKDFGL